MGEHGLGQARGRAIEQAWREALALQAVARERAGPVEDRGTVVTPVVGRWRVWTGREQ